MKNKLKAIAFPAFEGIYHLSRYGLAAGITALALAILPLVVAVILTIVGGICTAALTLMLFVSAVSGAADPPIFALGLAVLLPIVFVLAIVVVFSVTIASVFLFTGLVILPISLLVDIALRLVSVRQTLAQVAGFIVVGGLTGLLASAIWIFFKPQLDMLTVVVVAIWLFLLCASSVILFGLVLTMTDTARVVVGRITSRLYRWIWPHARSEMPTLQPNVENRRASLDDRLLG